VTWEIKLIVLTLGYFLRSATFVAFQSILKSHKYIVVYTLPIIRYVASGVSTCLPRIMSWMDGVTGTNTSCKLSKTSNSEISSHSALSDNIWPRNEAFQTWLSFSRLSHPHSKIQSTNSVFCLMKNSAGLITTLLS
jgi:hypothetical protein